MKLIYRQDIDTQRWDQQVSASSVETIFQYSWYLDAVCPNWCALITEDYKTILPVSFSQKLGVKQMIQAQFTREYSIIGEDFNWTQVIERLSSEFKSMRFRCASELAHKHSLRYHQLLNLNQEFESGYSTNAKRILKKTGQFSLQKSETPDILLNLFKEHVAHKIETLSAGDLRRLRQLMLNALQQNAGELLLVLEKDRVVAGGFFLKDKTRVTYLKGASEEIAKKNGAMYFLLDQAFHRYKPEYSTFDFGGSDIDKVAEFYHKFGASDRAYFDYQLGKVPGWYDLLKKLRP